MRNERLWLNILRCCFCFMCCSYCRCSRLRRNKCCSQGGETERLEAVEEIDGEESEAKEAEGWEEGGGKKVPTEELYEKLAEEEEDGEAGDFTKEKTRPSVVGINSGGATEAAEEAEATAEAFSSKGRLHIQFFK